MGSLGSARGWLTIGTRGDSGSDGRRRIDDDVAIRRRHLRGEDIVGCGVSTALTKPPDDPAEAARFRKISGSSRDAEPGKDRSRRSVALLWRRRRLPPGLQQLETLLETKDLQGNTRDAERP